MTPHNDAVEPFSVNKINRTKPGFNEIKEGFSPTIPNVGTVTHDFSFTVDPWQISSTAGNILFELSQIKLSVSKIFNINNTTDSFYVLSWNPNYSYRTRFPNEPAVTLYLFDANGALLDTGELGILDAICGFTGRQSKRKS